MKLIPLTQGQFAQVDDWNYDLAMQYKWYAVKFKNTFYAKNNGKIVNGKRKGIYLHRLIMNTPADLQTDHKDHNGLNCLEENMRNATITQNRINSIITTKKKSLYRGVSSMRTKWRAYIKVDKKFKHIGVFNTQKAAAIAHDEAAKKYHGEFAVLNFK